MRRVPRGDDGAYAILYALLLTVVVGIAATVVDLAAMRENRRHGRLAADAAAVAGARALDPLGGGNPRKACTDAWGYVASNMGFDVPGTTGCDAFPVAITSCPNAELTATGTVDGVTVTVTWPVLQTSALLTAPDARPAADSVTARGVDPAVDGEAGDACARLGVTVDEVQETFLASAFGVDETTTSATSVARALAVPGNPEAIAALNVLNPTACHAIQTSGQGFVLVNAVGDRPGIISVESDGRIDGGKCPQSQPYVIRPAENQSGAYVRADGPGGAAGEGKGFIYSYALNDPPRGNPAGAFNAGIVPPGGILLRPRPTLLTKRVGGSPVRDVYDCTAPCDDYPLSYVDRLAARLGTGVPPQPYEYAETPYDLLPFATLPGGAVPGFTCNDGPGSRVLVPVGNWYVNCDTLNVAGTLVFAGGTVVTKGGINVSGCFALNVPASSPPSCPAVSAGEVTPAPVKGAILYLRGGSFSKGAQGSVLMPRTFTYMTGGAVGFGGGSGTVFWSNPRQTDPLCTSDECQARRFSKLSLWNESTTAQSLGGQSSLTMRGVVFVPNARFRYSGQPTQNQTNAQFWADTIEVTGQSGLTMAPDPNDAIATPALGVVLIR